ncbi:MAG: hypothetical protein AB7F64_09540, partial [Gammaproteobacteria bacterium]
YHQARENLKIIWTVAKVKASIAGYPEETSKQLATVTFLKEAYIGHFYSVQWRSFSSQVAKMVRDFENPNERHNDFQHLLKDLLALQKTPEFNRNGRLYLILSVLKDKDVLRNEMTAAAGGNPDPFVDYFDDSRVPSVSASVDSNPSVKFQAPKQDSQVSCDSAPEQIEARIIEILSHYRKITNNTKMKAAVGIMITRYERNKQIAANNAKQSSSVMQIDPTDLCRKLHELDNGTDSLLKAAIETIADEFPQIWNDACNPKTIFAKK